MAHQQMPLNSLGVGGNNHHLDTTAATSKSYEVIGEASAYSEMDAGQQNHQHQHSNSYNDYPPPPSYPGQTDDRYITSSSASLSMLSPRNSVSGSLPPITSFGIRHSPMAQLASTGPSQPQQSSVVPLPSTSSQSSAACSPSPSPYQQHNNNHNPFMAASASANNSQQQHQQIQRIQKTDSGNLHGPQQPFMGYGQNHQYQPQQMPSPAYSSHPANSISNPGSIMSAAPESPSSIRSPSVRSNYSLRLVNSTPDPFLQNNSNSEHSYSLDALVHQSQDGQVDGINQLAQQKITATTRTAKRNCTPRTQRIKTPVLPLFQLDGPNPAMVGSPGEGPTVRQHLQQQQAAHKQRLQQELMLKRLMKEEASAPYQGNNSGTNGDREDKKKPQVESAPPSVAQSSVTASLDGCPAPSFGGFQLAEWSPASGNSNQLQKITVVAANTPVHQMFKAESLSPPKRNNGNRSRASGQGQRRIGGQLHSVEAASSSEALASTIASVASGGGSLEEFEKLSAASSGPGCSPSTSHLSNTLTTHSGTSIVEQNFTTIPPSAPKRRKVAATVQATQKLSPLVMATNTPIRQMESTSDSLIDPPPTQQHQMQQMSLSKQPQLPQKQQCRIHVQNPPQNHGDFPVTGTKIQVVHMKPSPATSSISGTGTLLQQTEFSPQSYPSTRPSFDLIGQGSRQHASPYAADANMLEMTTQPSTPSSISENIGGLMCSPRGTSSHSAFHAAPPQPPRSQILARLTPGLPMQTNELQPIGNSFPQQLAGSASSPSITPLTMVKSPQQNCSFQHPNTIPNRQQQQQYTCAQIPPKYASPTQQNQEQQQQSFSGQPSPQIAVLAGGPSPSPHSQQVQYSPMALPPPSTPMAQSPQMARFHQQLPTQQHSPLGLQPSQTPPNQQQSPMAYHQAMPQAGNAMSSPHHYQQQKQQLQQKSAYIGKGNQTVVIPQQHSPMQMFSPNHPQQLAQREQQHQSAYMSTTPRHQSPNLKQLHQTSSAPPPPQSGIFTAGPSPGPQQQQSTRVFATTSACPAPPPVGPQLPPPRAQLSRAQLLSRHAREVECQKYTVKLYHLQRTLKALVYKNGALADELARLNQRIQVVTEERRVLAKRLQHHERNRIRRIQTQFRKRAAAAAAEAAKEEFQPIASSSNAHRTTAEIKTGFDSSVDSSGAAGEDEGNEEQEGINRPGNGEGKTGRTSAEKPQSKNEHKPPDGDFNESPSTPLAVPHLPSQIQLDVSQQQNSSGSFPGSLMVSPRSDCSDVCGGMNGGGNEHHVGGGGGSAAERMTLRSRTASSNSTATASRELSMSPADQLGHLSSVKMATKGRHEQRPATRQSLRQRGRKQLVELRRSQSSDRQKIINNVSPNEAEVEGKKEQQTAAEDDGGHETNSDQHSPISRKTRQHTLNMTKKTEKNADLTTKEQLRSITATMATRRPSPSIQTLASQHQNREQRQANCIEGSQHLATSGGSSSPEGGDQEQKQGRKMTGPTTAAATVGSLIRRS